MLGCHKENHAELGGKHSSCLKSVAAVMRKYEQHTGFKDINCAFPPDTAVRLLYAKSLRLWSSLDLWLFCVHAIQLPSMNVE